MGLVTDEGFIGTGRRVETSDIETRTIRDRIEENMKIKEENTEKKGEEINLRVLDPPSLYNRKQEDNLQTIR
jgi:hypothetical protein